MKRDSDVVKLQVKIPAKLYWELKAEAAKKEMSFAELLIDALWAHRAFET